MSVLLRIAAAYLVLVAAAIPIHFIITPLYHPGGDAPFTAWHVMNWFMAPAMFITLAASYAEKRRINGNGAVDLKRYLEVNSVFYGSVAVSIIYFWNWFNSLSPNHVADEQFWSVLGAAMPIVMGVIGIRLWQHASAKFLVGAKMTETEAAGFGSGIAPS